MKIVCVSDTHLENERLASISERYPNMDFYIHCGDSSLSINSPLLDNYYVVRGNHDDAPFEEKIILSIGRFRCLIIHGNRHDVFYNYDKVIAYMNANNIDICFHGHTHVPTLYHQDNKIIINPGSVMINRASYGFGTFAIIEITDIVHVDFYHSETFALCTKLALSDGKKTLDLFKDLKK